ncbi:uncharacterized protein LOC142542221 [Primulina tabacum]|uniref:uncharacterized protein LOC142542221 n=1 Tax=Primulina tabacum TaxID=48773 RepID=UPI003F5ACC09
MSRCFPFPPPGYERKHRPEEIDLLKEAKRKEKKHKKDQKDKDRSKDKEKGEKDGSDEKHRDKKDRKGKHKDRKEKHRDKKKDKDDRGKDKEKSSISEESTVAGKLGEKGHASLRPKGESKDRSSIADEGKVSAPFPGQNGGRPFQNSQPSLENKESKFLQELDRRIRADETSRASSQLPEGLAGLDKSCQETASRSARNSSGTLAEEKMSYNKDKRVDTRKMDAQGVRNETGGNSTVQNFATFGKSKVDGIPRPEEGNIDSRREDKEKSKEIGDNKHRDKHKDKDKVGKRVEKEKDRKKKKEEKKIKEKLKVETESKKTEEEKPRDLANNDLVGVTSNKGTDFLKDVKNSIITDGNIKKRKDMATNGFFLANETRPMKMPRPTPHQSTENGRKLETYRTPSASASNKHVVPSSVLHDKGERLINGMIEAQKSSSSKPITSSTMISDQLNEGSKVSLHNSSYLNKAPPEPKMEDPIAEATRRPPHPDSKYLNEVLTVPKLGDWSEHDDQGWLFSKQQPPSTRMKSESVLVTEQHVWSKAVVIKSADVCAMPYVVPF